MIGNVFWWINMNTKERGEEREEEKQATMHLQL